MYVGSPIRKPGVAHDPSACPEAAVPVVGLDMGTEHYRRGGGKSAVVDAPVPPSNFFSRLKLRRLWFFYLCADGPPLFQSSSRNTALFFYVTLAAAFLSYARFWPLVFRIATIVGVGHIEAIGGENVSDTIPSHRKLSMYLLTGDCDRDE